MLSLPEGCNFQISKFATKIHEWKICGLAREFAGADRARILEPCLELVFAENIINIDFRHNFLGGKTTISRDQFTEKGFYI